MFLLLPLFRTAIPLKQRRFYARGSRFYRESDLSSSDRKDELNNASQSSNSADETPRRIGRESVKELLENAASFKEVSHEKPKTVEDIWNSGPYPKGSVWKQSQAKHSVRPSCDPSQTSIILFPGQGIRSK